MNELIGKLSRALREYSAKKAQKEVFRIISEEKRASSILSNQISNLAGSSLADASLANHFSKLGIKPTRDKIAIRNAYIKKVKEYHPDTSKKKNAEEIMKEINYAYSELIGKVNNYTYANSQTAIGKKFLEEYSKARNDDFSLLLNSAKSAKSRDEIYSYAMRFIDWEPTFRHSEEAMLGRLIHYIKKSERIESKAKSLLEKIGNSNNLAESTVEFSKDVTEARRFYESARSELEKLKSVIAAAEAKQKDSILRAIG